VALEVLDETSSFRPFRSDCVPDFLTVAGTVAERGGDLYAGALLTGDPFGKRFLIEEHFAKSVPAAIKGNDELARNYRRRRARALTPRFDQLTTSVPDTPGSPILDTLARVARFKQERVPPGSPFWLVMCSDLANVGNGLDARKPISDQMVDRAAAAWAGPLSGLRGTDFYFIGAGRRSEADIRPDSVRQVERLLIRLAADQRVGAHVRLIDTQLGQVFPLEGAAGGGGLPPNASP
jgi:hypothetical protein